MLDLAFQCAIHEWGMREVGFLDMKRRIKEQVSSLRALLVPEYFGARSEGEGKWIPD